MAKKPKSANDREAPKKRVRAAATGEPSLALTINGGSSSIRFATFQAAASLRRVLDGRVERIGLSGTRMVINDPIAPGPMTFSLGARDHGRAVDFVLDWIQAQPWFSTIRAVGHRLVYGMGHSKAAVVTPELLDELHRLTPYDPVHLPREIALIEALGQRHPHLPQVVCFDTAFHSTMPQVARVLPIPRRYQARGVMRYGFHGLSYAYLMEELARLGDPAAVDGRVILAHLGNGASLAAVRDGRSIDTSMGFTPTGGLVMSTRSGDIDPGLVCFLADTEQMTATEFQHLVNHESGLLGVSETSSDVRELLAREAEDVRAAEAVALFCYQAKKWIGSFAAALGGLDSLVFSGGIGENAPLIRARICEGLEFLGVALSETRNGENAAVISTDGGPVAVRVIHTDEELMIARSMMQILNLNTQPEIVRPE